MAALAAADVPRPQQILAALQRAGRHLTLCTDRVVRHPLIFTICVHCCVSVRDDNGWSARTRLSLVRLEYVVASFSAQHTSALSPAEPVDCCVLKCHIRIPVATTETLEGTAVAITGDCNGDQALAATGDLGLVVSTLMKTTCGAATLDGQLSVSVLLEEVSRHLIDSASLLRVSALNGSCGSLHEAQLMPKLLLFDVPIGWLGGKNPDSSKCVLTSRSEGHQEINGNCFHKFTCMIHTTCNTCIACTTCTIWTTNKAQQDKLCANCKSEQQTTYTKVAGGSNPVNFDNARN